MNSDTAKTERDLTNATIQIGNIAECPWYYRMGLAKMINASGKPLGEMTVSELLSMNRQHKDRLNEAADRIISARFHLCKTTENEAAQ